MAHVPALVAAQPRAGVLITRPEPAAGETARLLAGRGFDPIIAPMLVVTPHGAIRAMAGVQAILVTSANALAALGGFDRAILVLAVGDATAAAARDQGFQQVESAGRDAQALAGLALQRCRPARGSVLLASGAGQGIALAHTLRDGGLRVHRRVAYRARAVKNLPAAVLAALASGRVQHALFFSTATAAAFAACMQGCEPYLVDIAAHAISPSTAEPLSALPWRSLDVASLPNQDELVALVS